MTCHRSLRNSFLFPLISTVFALSACTSPSGSNAGGVWVDGAGGTDGTTSSDATTGQDAATAADTATEKDAGSAPKPGKEVDPGCTDGKYKEVLPNGKEPIDDLIANYKSDATLAFITGVLAKRYPFGKTLVEGAIANAKQHCVDLFLPQSQRGTASQVLSRMGVIVHECGHFFDLYAKGKGFGQSHYQFHEAVAFTCSGGGHQGQKTTFSRSLIKGDKWNAANPACANFGDKGCDSYAPIYLNGDPTDSKFESGDQGFNMLMEEVVQYVNSLAEAVAFYDQIKGSTSARDGILTFLWYMERYLQMARLKYPESYKVITDDACWRDTILTVWGRAWLYLNATEGDSKLTIKGEKLLKNVREPELMAEIERVRIKHGCK